MRHCWMATTIASAGPLLAWRRWLAGGSGCCCCCCCWYKQRVAVSATDLAYASLRQHHISIALWLEAGVATSLDPLSLPCLLFVIVAIVRSHPPLSCLIPGDWVCMTTGRVLPPPTSWHVLTQPCLKHAGSMSWVAVLGWAAGCSTLQPLSTAHTTTFCLHPVHPWHN